MDSEVAIEEGVAQGARGVVVEVRRWVRRAEGGHIVVLKK